MNDKELENLIENNLINALGEQNIFDDYGPTERQAVFDIAFESVKRVITAIMSKTAPQNDISEGVMSNKALNKSGEWEDILSIISAVAHTGVDFGYGPYQINEGHITMGRAHYNGERDTCCPTTKRAGLNDGITL